MPKISDETRSEFTDAIKPYQAKINAVLNKEKDVLNIISKNPSEAPKNKLMLCDDMIYVSSLYMAENALSVKLLEVKNQDALNDSRKMLYKAIIYLEDLVTNTIDIPYIDLAPNQDKLKEFSVNDRYCLIRELGLAINLLEMALGDNSKWKWSFVELKGRYCVVAKNLIDMRKAAKTYFNPSDEDYEVTVIYIRLITKLLDSSSAGYRDKYELSTRRLDDMKNGIKFLLAKHKLCLALGDKNNAEEVKKKAVVWKDKMNADQKTGASK